MFLGLRFVVNLVVVGVLVCGCRLPVVGGFAGYSALYLG